MNTNKPTRLPPDPKRCQAEKAANFMTLGAVPGTILSRCTNIPVVIASERRKGKDGLKGKMSLCPGCLQAFMIQDGDKIATIEPIGKFK